MLSACFIVGIIAPYGLSGALLKFFQKRKIKTFALNSCCQIPSLCCVRAEPPFPWVSLWIPLIPLLLLNTQADHILAITGALSFTDRYHWWFLLTHTSCLCCSCPTLLHYYKLLLSFAILCLIFKHCRLTFGLSHDSSLQSLDLWGQSQWVPLQARRTPSKAGHLKPALTSASRLLTEQRDHLWLLGKESSQHVECCTSVGPVIEDVLLWFMVCARCLLFFFGRPLNEVWLWRLLSFP